MDLVTFKVIFRAFEQFEKKNLSLSFLNIISEKRIEIPNNLILKLKHLSEKKKTIINFQNIEEVILLGNPKSNYIFNFYLVILYTLKLKGKQQGYLIGNVKKWGYLLIGVWPFNIELSTITEDDILKNLKDIVNNLTKYSKICLISQ
ncbi:MAG TPA: hypothetical protein ENH75_13895 [archaeon]|nr:hypothetical protein [archaeon]